MKSILYDLNDNVISEYIRVLPDLDTIMSESRLLDGSWHIQTIGSGARLVGVTLICNDAGRSIIENAASTGTQLKVTSAENRYYIGVIRKAGKGVLNWKRFSSRMWEVEIALLVSDEGVLV